MPSWSNWSGKLRAKPKRLHYLRSEEDACALAASASQQGARVRVSGATHSHAPLVQHDDVIADACGLSGVIETDVDSKTAWVWAGSRIYALGRALREDGLALANQGDIDQQAISGATATGTHGTGTSLKNLSACVVGAQIALASGELVECSQDENVDLWQASRLHLGAFGIITRLKLKLVDAYRLQETAWQSNLDGTLENFPAKAAKHRHHEFFWHPQENSAQGKSIDITQDAAAYPLAEEGHRCAWSYEVLPNHRPHKHTEMEYSVPAQHGPACMREIGRLLTSKFPDVRWPVEYRTLAADDVWLSSAFRRDTVTISVHQDIKIDDEPYFRACEEVFLNFDGRPHWGKVNYLDAHQLEAMHPKWHAWWSVRNEVDPKGTFLNDYLQQFR